MQSGIVIVYGVGAAYLCEHPDLLIYADMARWEIQSRFRKNEISNIGVNNKEERTSLQYKRAFFEIGEYAIGTKKDADGKGGLCFGYEPAQSS